MGRYPFTVIGVLAGRGADSGGLDRDDVVFVPLTTAMRNLDRREWVTDIMCAVASPEQMDSVELQTAALLRERHGLPAGAADDSQIQKPLETLQLRAEAAHAMTFMLTAIGGVSLLVGGIGIMNIMLVSVTERRREIGVRMALGARVRDIRLQFLFEAALIGLVGGVVGIVIGWAGAQVLSRGFDWPTVVSIEAVLLATASAIGAALLFGYYPAHRASNMEPLDAIRLES
ncbi:MAG: ABC transporter permease [Vicinamibacterales bacterium]